MVTSLLLLALAQVDAPAEPPCDRKAWLASLTDEATLRAEVAPVDERQVPWQETHVHPCGAVSTSDDAKVRLWVPSYEQIEEDVGLKPGEAHLQWLDDNGRVHVRQLDASLHLDSVVDRVVSLGKGRYLFLGLRSCFAIYAGSCPRRYARIVQLGTSDVVTSVALVLFSAPSPETGKFRHHLLAANWLAWRDGKVWLEKFPGKTYGPELKATAVLEVRDGRLAQAGKPPGALTIARGW